MIFGFHALLTFWQTELHHFDWNPLCSSRELFGTKIIEQEHSVLKITKNFSFEFKYFIFVNNRTGWNKNNWTIWSGKLFFYVAKWDFLGNLNQYEKMQYKMGEKKVAIASICGKSTESFRIKKKVRLLLSFLIV